MSENCSYRVLVNAIEDQKNPPNIICILETVSPSTQLALISFSNQFFDQN